MKVDLGLEVDPVVSSPRACPWGHARESPSLTGWVLQREKATRRQAIRQGLRQLSSPSARCLASSELTIFYQLVPLFPPPG